MKTLEIFIEIKGDTKHVGSISGKNVNDARFRYSEDYLSSDYGSSISVALPLSENAFSPKETKCFFEGLLPEGFSRRAVANWIKADENDYLTILSALGNECIGAIKVSDDSKSEADAGRYERLSIEQVKELAKEGATKSTEILVNTHLSLAGASGKVGLYYDDQNDEWYLPKGNAPSTHIVKQSHVRLPQIVINEQLSMLSAKNLGIEVPESFIINTGKGSDPEILYATKRYDRMFNNDRKINGMPVPCRLHQVDFAQAMGVPSAEKYEKNNAGYMGRMFDIIRENASDPISEQLKLWKMICFNFLIGNTDAHIKNFSLLYSDNLKKITLAPFYDVVSTRVYNLTNEMSFYIGNEIDIEKMNRSTFAAASAEAGLSEKMALKIFDETADGFEKALDEATGTLSEAGYSEANEIKEMIKTKGGWRGLF